MAAVNHDFRKKGRRKFFRTGLDRGDRVERVGEIKSSAHTAVPPPRPLPGALRAATSEAPAGLAASTRPRVVRAIGNPHIWLTGAGPSGQRSAPCTRVQDDCPPSSMILSAVRPAPNYHTGPKRRQNSFDAKAGRLRLCPARNVIGF